MIAKGPLIVTLLMVKCTTVSFNVLHEKNEKAIDPKCLTVNFIKICDEETKEVMGARALTDKCCNSMTHQNKKN